MWIRLKSHSSINRKLEWEWNHENERNGTPNCYFRTSPDDSDNNDISNITITHNPQAKRLLNGIANMTAVSLCTLHVFQCITIYVTELFVFKWEREWQGVEIAFRKSDWRLSVSMTGNELKWEWSRGNERNGTPKVISAHLYSRQW